MNAYRVIHVHLISHIQMVMKSVHVVRQQMSSGFKVIFKQCYPRTLFPNLIIAHKMEMLFKLEWKSTKWFVYILNATHWIGIMIYVKWVIFILNAVWFFWMWFWIGQQLTVKNLPKKNPISKTNPSLNSTLHVLQSSLIKI